MARVRATAPIARRAACALALLLLLATSASAQFPAVVRGRVVDASSGATVAAARVEVVGSGQGAVTEPDGTFVLRGLLPGRRELRVAALGFAERTVEVAAENGRVVSVRVELVPAPLDLAGVTAVGDRAADAAGALVIGRARIEAAGARDAAELLRGAAGLTVQQRGGPGSPAVLSIRGGSGDEVLVLLDGVPLNSPLTGEADLSTIPLEAVERVVVLRGAQSARYGGRALAGVVAVETRRPDETELAARLGLGAHGERAGALVLGGSRGGAAGRWGGLLSLEHRDARGDFGYAVPRVRGGGDAVRRNADSELLSVLATGRWDDHGGRVLRGRLEALRVERGMPGSIVQPALLARQSHRRVGAGGELRAQWRALQWELGADAQAQRAEYADPAPPFGPPYAERVGVATLATTLAASSTAGPLRLAGGAELRRLAVESTMLDAGAPDAQQQSGAWIQATGSWPVSPRWSTEVSAGARADHSSLVGEVLLSPQAAATLAGGRTTLRLSVGSAFSPPSLADQFFQEGVLARPNPELEPERVRWELQAAVATRDHRLGPLRMDAELAAFRADVDGMILWFPDHRFIWQPSNFDVRRRGWEASTRVSLPGGTAEWTASLSRAAVSYRGGVLGGQVRYRPEHTASSTLAVPLLGARAELSTRYVGQRRTVAGSALNTLPAYWLADLRLARDLRFGGWTLQVTSGIDNLFDRDAAMFVDYPHPGRAWRLSARARRDP